MLFSEMDCLFHLSSGFGALVVGLDACFASVRKRFSSVSLSTISYQFT